MDVEEKVIQENVKHKKIDSSEVFIKIHPFRFERQYIYVHTNTPHTQTSSTHKHTQYICMYVCVRIYERLHVNILYLCIT